MAWMPGAQVIRLPENSTAPALKPKQLTLHSACAPWSGERLGEYWNTINLESHFYVEYDGSVFQYMDSGLRADAQAAGNAYALSVETASNIHATDAWTDAQLEGLARIGVWAATTHGIPAHMTPSWDGAGIGYHCLFRQWNPNAHACPGAARQAQMSELISDIYERLRQPVGATPTTPTHPAFPGRTITLWDKGGDVRLWQGKMKMRGWDITVDGVYGPKSEATCRSFQKEKHLTVNGKVGRQTWNATWEAKVTG